MSTIESTTPGAFISLSTAADMLGISVHTLRRRIAAGDLPAFRTGKRIIRVRVSDLEKLLLRVPTAERWQPRGPRPDESLAECPKTSVIAHLIHVRADLCIESSQITTSAAPRPA